MTTIYVMKNTENDKIYIGQTTKTLDNRLKHHKGQVGYDKSSIHTAMGEIGRDKFYAEKLEIVPDDIADEAEIKWMQHFLNLGFSLYNDKYTAGKCGGDTLTNNKNLDEIREKIRNKCLGADNSNATAIDVIDTYTGKIVTYGCIKDCQKAMGIERHDIICRRCNGKIKKLYLNRYKFRYSNEV